jgi:hypothetical protein
MSLRANCPACGGPCEFKVGTSLVTVCPYCRSVVGRGDKGLEDLGKVADLVESGSPLDLWLKGRYDGVPFTLTGRVQFSHPAGGIWDEWYAAFADGRWGWLAEAQGRFYLTFQKPTPPDLPGFAELKLGQNVTAAPNTPPLTVVEKNTGKTTGARGEIPYRLIPGQEHPFADLSGPDGTFGTLDYSESAPQVFLGRQVTLDELGIPPGKRRKVTPGQGPTIAAVQLNCPNCGGALSLRAPDKSERVGCPNCGSLLDVQEGKLRLLQSLKPPKVQPVIPLGATCQHDGAHWTVLGFMQRAVTFEGTDYFWEEYLLYQPRLGFRWLVRSDDHWNWVEPLPPGAVAVSGREARYAGKSYSLFQKAKARVVFVLGEFYWKVQAGEQVRGRDFVHAPEMLSEEVTREGDAGEINWSRGTYLPPEQVQRLFGLKGPLPAPTDIGPNQPFPHSGVYRSALLLLLLAFLLTVALWIISPNRRVFGQSFSLSPPGKGAHTRTVQVQEPIELKGHRNIHARLISRSSGWVFLRGELVREQPPPTPGAPARAGRAHREVFTLSAPAGQTSSVFLSAVPAGRYHLELTAEWQDPKQPVEFELRLTQGVAHLLPLVLTFLILGAVPFLVGLYNIYFEARRWQNSNTSG